MTSKSLAIRLQLSPALRKGGLGICKSEKTIDPCQPAQFAQADMGRNVFDI